MKYWFYIDIDIGIDINLIITDIEIDYFKILFFIQ